MSNLHQLIPASFPLWPPSARLKKLLIELRHVCALQGIEIEFNLILASIERLEFLAKDAVAGHEVRALVRELDAVHAANQRLARVNVKLAFWAAAFALRNIWTRKSPESTPSYNIPVGIIS